MKAEGRMKDFNVTTIAECQEKLGTIVQTIIGTAFLGMILLQFHFFSIVHTHWKNHAKDHSTEVERHNLVDETA